MSLETAEIAFFYKFFVFFFSMRLIKNVILFTDEPNTAETIHAISAIYEVITFHAIGRMMAEK